MPSMPSAKPAALAPARVPKPRHERSYITSYGDGRVCDEPGCDTMLSRYNQARLCFHHSDELDARRRRGVA